MMVSCSPPGIVLMWHLGEDRIKRQG